MSTRILAASGAAVLALVAACSSSSTRAGGGGGYGGGGYGGGGGGGSSQATPASPQAGAVTISLTGSTLTGPDGRTLYENTLDTASTISCTGACAKAWPPVTGPAKAGSGVQASRLATITRPDGTTQVSFDGHPLYEFTADQSPGDTKGEGVADGGGTWHVATLSGPGAGASGSSASTDAGTGIGY